MTGKNSEADRARLQCHAANMAQAKVLRSSFDCSDCGTLMEIGQRLRDHVCAALVEYAHEANPLERELSSWVWIRGDGSIVVEECVLSKAGREYVDLCRDMVLVIFPTANDATPDSQFYARVKDRRGNFYGSVASRWRGFPPVWQDFHRADSDGGRRIEILSGERITFCRFRLERLPPADVITRIQNREHLRALGDRLLAWLVDSCSDLVEAQNFSGLSRALFRNDPTLITALGGKEHFRALMLRKAQEHLTRRVSGETATAGAVAAKS